MTELDEALVVRSRRGDRAAFEELVRRTARLLFAHLYLKTSDVHKTEDLVQETFLIAWRSIADLDEPKTFRAWLTTMIAIQAVDWLATVGYVAAGAVTLAQVSTASFLPLLFIAGLAAGLPSRTAVLSAGAET